MAFAGPGEIGNEILHAQHDASMTDGLSNWFLGSGGGQTADRQLAAFVKASVHLTPENNSWNLPHEPAATYM